MAKDPLVQVTVIDAQTGQILFGLDSHRLAPAASTTKVMTLYQVAKHISRADTDFNLKTIVKVPKIAIERSRGLADFDNVLEEHRYSLRDLLIGAGARSDARSTITVAMATAKARHNAGDSGWGGDQEAQYARFIQEMNNTAPQLGMRETNFRNVTGDNGSFSTSYDIAMLMRAFEAEFPKLFRIALGQSSFSIPTTNRTTNSSRFFRENTNSVVAAKTGWLTAADYNEVAFVKANDGREYIISMFGADSPAHRQKLMEKYLDWINSPEQIPKRFLLVKDTPIIGAKNDLNASWSKFAPQTAPRPEVKPNTIAGTQFQQATSSSQAAPQNAPRARPRPDLYVMRDGDTIWGLADDFGISPKYAKIFSEMVMARNEIENATLLRPGRRLIITEEAIKLAAA